MDNRDKRIIHVKTGYHAIYESNYFEAIDHAESNGFEFVQFDLNIPEYFLDEIPTRDLLKIRDHARSRNIIITFHAPGDNVSLFCDYPLIRKGILDQFKVILEKANILEARHLTIHAGAMPGGNKSGSKTDEFSITHADHYMQVLYGNLKELIRNCKNVLICLENYQFSDPVMRAAQKIIDEKGRLYLTLDTAKMYTKQYVIDDNAMRFMQKNKSSIREIHIHDIIAPFGSHQIVGTGIVDFELFKEFMESDDVFINFEVRPVESARISKEKLFAAWTE